MSSDLSMACDNLLNQTSILSHSFGIPQLASSISTTRQNKSKVAKLEQQYYTLHHELTNKLNTLVYTKNLNSLQDDDDIDNQYTTVKNSLPLVDEDDLESFLKVHNSTIKTEQLLNNYLQTILPILRSIHHSKDDLTSSELNIHNNLQKLYSLGETGTKGSMFQLMDSFNKSISESQTYSIKVLELSKMLAEEVRPQLVLYHDVSNQMYSKSNHLISTKESLINSQVDKSQHHLQIRDTYLELVEKWDYLGKLCQFLPMLISCLPVNWFNDEDLFKIIQDCEMMSEKLERYQLVINVNTIRGLSPRELLMIEFEELSS